MSKVLRATDTFIVAPALGLTVQDKKLVDYFYGVQQNEVRPNRPLYAGKTTLNYYLLLTSVWNMTANIQLLGQIKYESLGNGITQSPIVNKDSITSFVLGTIYRF